MQAHETTPAASYHPALSHVAWILLAAVNILAIFVWGQSFDWQFGNLSPYLLFPVLGLIAFSTMWTHYIIDFLKNFVAADTHTKQYVTVTSWVVLVAICLHPGILIYQRFHDGYGLPPGSYESYVAPGLGWVTVLGSASLLVFLAYELRRRYKQKAWWKYVTYLNDTAMLAIFYHSLRLGSQLQSGWFEYIWYFYGLSLVYVLGYKYAQKLTAHRAQSH